MTGLDLSPASLAEARRLAAAAGAPVEYVEADIYSAPALGGRTFDLVYTGMGALCWLPDIDRWAASSMPCSLPAAAPSAGGATRMMWAVDEALTDALTLGYPYFETPEPIDDEEPGTYVDTDVEFANNRAMSWNHGLGETVTALLARGLEIRPWSSTAASPGRPTSGWPTRAVSGPVGAATPQTRPGSGRLSPPGEERSRRRRRARRCHGASATGIRRGDVEHHPPTLDPGHLGEHHPADAARRSHRGERRWGRGGGPGRQ